MLKKAKIINISLNSPKNSSPKPLHLSTDPSESQLQNYSQLKCKQIIEDCFEAINIISIERQKQQQKTKKISKIQTEPIQLYKKTSRECDVRLSLTTAQSIEFILKSFIKSKMDEQNHKPISTSSKKRKLLQKNFFSRTMVLKNYNENTQSSYFNGSKQQFEPDIFQNSLANSKFTQKLNNKIHFLESQITVLKEKLRQKDERIEKLEAKQSLIRKRYKNQVAKMVRSQNILNINKFFEKELTEFNEGQYFLNIKGTNLKSNKKNDTRSLNITSKNNRNQLQIPLILSNKKQHKVSFKTSQNSRIHIIGPGTNQKITSEAALESIKSLIGKGISDQNLSSTNIKQISNRTKLKKQLEQFYKLKQQIIEDINQKNHLMEKQLEELDAKIIDKMKQISKEEQLITDQQLKLLKQEDFEELQLNGFYQPQSLKANIENQ